MSKRVHRIPDVSIEGVSKLPPAFYLSFNDAEFAKFIADPVDEMKKNGLKFDRMTVMLGDKAWVDKDGKWEAPNAAARAIKKSGSGGPSVEVTTWICICSEDGGCVCVQVK